MSVDSVPRGTRRSARLSFRVRQTVKDRVRDAALALKASGTRVSASELLEMFVDEGLHDSPETLEQRLRQWRMRQEEASS